MLAKAGFVAAFLFLDFLTIRGLLAYVAIHEGPADALFVFNCLARVAVAIFLATFMAFVILRSPAKRKAAGFLPRLLAFTGTYLMISMPIFQVHEMPLPIAILSSVLVFAGDGFAIFVVWRLGRSISLMAEARQLVTTGPYAVVRHPLYLAEELAIVGTWLQFASPVTTAMLVLHALVQLQRMVNEERVLGAEFPEEYATYAARTPRLIPGIY